jgi:hypothetical protein
MNRRRSCGIGFVVFAVAVGLHLQTLLPLLALQFHALFDFGQHPLDSAKQGIVRLIA